MPINNDAGREEEEHQHYPDPDADIKNLAKALLGGRKYQSR